MGTTADKLSYLNGTKTAIKNAIVAKGVAVPDGTTFRAYADKISSIQDVSSLPTQGAKTVTPTTSEQIAVASGRYTTGDVKVAGDANLVAENIAEGVSIFGVAGAHSGAKIAYGTYLVRNNPSSYAIECDFEPNYGVLSFMDTLFVYDFEYRTSLFAMYCKNGVWTSYGFIGDGDTRLAQKCGYVNDPVSVSYLNGVLTFNLGDVGSINGEMVYLFAQK